MIEESFNIYLQNYFDLIKVYIFFLIIDLNLMCITFLKIDFYII